ncbi:hypothetical protein MCG98_18475 [Ruminococcus sp. OA3]|uniref:hypothetical protein n=1 Tax=Ruminococcus sp. OA3 TaxID=2914164 RepID=UPI001F062572|nr:hypothetical protein [Ruminococcus sp. OA3]MCH1984543.1 hypothetical protein [Ruminococcus sp. OA3]
MALKKIKDLELITEPADADDVIIENTSSQTKRTNIGSILELAVEKIKNVTFPGLTTTAKQLVESVNELDGEIGKLEDLTTNNKNSIVVAVNELDGKMQDSDWKTGTLSTSFAAAGGESANTPEYRKIGKTVFIRGKVSPRAALAGSASSVTIFSLPEGYRPSKAETLVCQGTGKSTWLLQIFAGGTVTFSRYGTNTLESCPTSAQLMFSASYLVD